MDRRDSLSVLAIIVASVSAGLSVVAFHDSRSEPYQNAPRRCRQILEESFGKEKIVSLPPSYPPPQEGSTGWGAWGCDDGSAFVYPLGGPRIISSPD
jgi:hypothetical protein